MTDQPDVSDPGTTRDNFNDKPVKQLEYSAYESLALKTMRSIAERAVQKHGLEGISIVHRLGVVPIGDIAYGSKNSTRGHVRLGQDRTGEQTERHGRRKPPSTGS